MNDIQSITDDFIEVGWSRGEYYGETQPQAFYGWKINGAFSSNSGLSARNEGQFDNFSIRDPDGNSRWSAFLNGDSLGQTPEVRFNRGVPFDASERHTAQDSGWGHFRQLEKCETLNCTNWKNPDNWRCYEDNALDDPDYYFDRDSNTENHVRVGNGC